MSKPAGDEDVGDEHGDEDEELDEAPAAAAEVVAADGHAHADVQHRHHADEQLGVVHDRLLHAV